MSVFASQVASGLLGVGQAVDALFNDRTGDPLPVVGSEGAQERETAFGSSGYELALTDPDWRIHDVNRTVVVDLQPEPPGQSRLLERYRFLAEELTDFVFSGFGEIALAHMFPDEPHGYRKSHEDSAP